MFDGDSVWGAAARVSDSLKKFVAGFISLTFRPKADRLASEPLKLSAFLSSRDSFAQYVHRGDRIPRKFFAGSPVDRISVPRELGIPVFEAVWKPRVRDSLGRGVHDVDSEFGGAQCLTLGSPRQSRIKSDTLKTQFFSWEEKFIDLLKNTSIEAILTDQRRPLEGGERLYLLDPLFFAVRERVVAHVLATDPIRHPCDVRECVIRDCFGEGRARFSDVLAKVSELAGIHFYSFVLSILRHF